jgi:hypothetical protein
VVLAQPGQWIKKRACSEVRDNYDWFKMNREGSEDVERLTECEMAVESMD